MINVHPLSPMTGKKAVAVSTSARLIKVLLVDDHPVVRDGYRHLLESAPDIQVIAEADNGAACCNSYKKYAPDVVVLDLNMPGIDGVETIRRIRSKDQEARILVFSMNGSEAIIRHVMEAGAKGYLDKKSGKQQMLEAVRQVAQGKVFIDKGHMGKMTASKLLSLPEDPLSKLSVREFQIFKLLSEGNSIAEIATTISISPKTVGGHHTSIMKKLGLQNDTQLTRMAIRGNIIEP